MDEFDLIKTYFAPLAGPEGLHLTDDTALFTARPNRDLLITSDTFIEGVHFPTDMYGADVAERLLRTNLSDIAAKGGTPRGYTLSISMQAEKMEMWVPAFAKGLATTQAEYGCALWGGDTTATNSQAVFSITLVGDVPKDRMVKRRGASFGHDIWVTGTLGDAMLGCYLVTNKRIKPPPNGQELVDFEAAYWRPEPAFAYRRLLLNFASASADISDGLMADAKHLANLNMGEMRIDFDALPFSPGAGRWADAQADPIAARQALASFGDDYGLVFTSHPKHRQAVFDMARDHKLLLTRVGSIGGGSGVVCLDVDGQEMPWPKSGFKHL